MTPPAYRVDPCPDESMDSMQLSHPPRTANEDPRPAARIHADGSLDLVGCGHLAFSLIASSFSGPCT
jgi:hypothetical protein